MTSKTVLACTLAAALVGGGCERTTTGEAVGGLGGAAAGGAIGSAAGGEAATALGVLGGALLGREIGRAAEGQDSIFAQDEAASVQGATVAALETGEPQKFDRGTTEGFVDVGPTFRNEEGQLCRQYSREVFVGEEALEDKGVACRTAAGWRDA